jgi:uncharacterized Tic20 family protein
MESSGAPAPAPPEAPGWYPDPGGSGSHRYWDGRRWTDALSSAIPPAGPHNARDDSHTYARVAHLSALLTIVVAFTFTGPLLVYLAKKDDPFVRRHAKEALNFNLSITLYACVMLLASLAVGGVLVLALLVLLVIVWIVFVGLAASKAGRGAEYRYPLTIRVVR